MKYKNIIFKIDEHVGVISMNRPDVLNSFNYEMADELLDSLETCNNNQDIRAVLIKGEGRAFCAGQDLEEATRKNGPSIGEIIDHTFNPIIKAIDSIDLPVICCVNGIAAGAGANLALACDVTFASESAKFIQSFVHIGLVPDTAGTWTLPRLIGIQKAAGLMFSGDKINAKYAEEIGMIYACEKDEEVSQTALDFAKKLSLLPTKSIAMTKKLLKESHSNSIKDQLDLEKKYQIIAAKSEDHQEGINAFFEKRKPNYKGK